MCLLRSLHLLSMLQDLFLNEGPVLFFCWVDSPAFLVEGRRSRSQPVVVEGLSGEQAADDAAVLLGT